MIQLDHKSPWKSIPTRKINQLGLNFVGVRQSLAMTSAARTIVSETISAGTLPDPAVAVIDAATWRPGIWHISQNLTDREGEINRHNAARKPLSLLENNPRLLERLRNQMWGEDTFVVRKDGVFGILFEIEFMPQESEDDNRLRPHHEVVDELVTGLNLMMPEFPGVQFAVPNSAVIWSDRPAVWAFVADGLLDDQYREWLGEALVDLLSERRFSRHRAS